MYYHWLLLWTLLTYWKEEDERSELKSPWVEINNILPWLQKAVQKCQFRTAAIWTVLGFVLLFLQFLVLFLWSGHRGWIDSVACGSHGTSLLFWVFIAFWMPNATLIWITNKVFFGKKTLFGIWTTKWWLQMIITELRYCWFVIECLSIGTERK